jgi:hypothetical protein
MSDLAERLRDFRDPSGWFGTGMKIREEAADEIERLTADLGTYKEMYDSAHAMRVEAEREALAAEAERDKLLANSDFDSKEHKRVRNELMNDIRRLATIVMDEYPESDDRYQIAADAIGRVG